MKLLKNPFLQIILLLCISVAAIAQDKPVNLTFFGSSVCWGSGATNDHGYAWQFAHSGAIDTIKYKYFNASTGGDNTIRVEKENRLVTKLFPTHPSIVVLGLSLSNEGIGNSSDDHGREEVLEQFRSRLLALADSLKRLHMFPVIVNCYTNNDFNQIQYDFTKRMNRIINTWDYPSVNVLGTVDDLTGKWVEGYFHDAGHPNDLGHKEMSYAIVPSLFDAILLGKKIPHYDWNRSYTTLLNKDKVARPLAMAFKSPMHSFTLSFRFRKATDGSIGGVIANKQIQSINIAGDQLLYKGLAVAYNKSQEEWTLVVLSHSYINQKTQLFVNGKLAGTVKEQLSPEQVVFGGTASTIDLKDLTLHRSALNASEALDLYDKKFIQSSLEFYNPLTKASSVSQLDNMAQSMTELKIDPKVMMQQQKVSF